jgi:hypothetical protein
MEKFQRGRYVLEFRTATGEALAISVPAGEVDRMRHACSPRLPFAHPTSHFGKLKLSGPASSAALAKRSS